MVTVRIDEPEIAEAPGTVTNRLDPGPKSWRCRDRAGIKRVDVIDLNLDLDSDSTRSAEVLSPKMVPVRA